MSARRYDLYGRLLPDTDPDSDWYWVHKPDFDAKERECERLREWITQAKHLSNCQFWHGHPSSESEPEVRRWIDGPCTCGRDAALKEQP